jgi:hypothetical protein
MRYIGVVFRAQIIISDGYFFFGQCNNRMPLSPNFSLGGIYLFSSQDDINSQLPTEDLKSRFLSISKIVSTHTNFIDESRFDQLLRLDFSSATLSVATNIAVVQNIIKNQDLNVGSCEVAGGNASNFYDSMYPRTMLRTTIDTTLGTNIINAMKARIQAMDARLEPIGYGTNLEPYRDIMKDVCLEIWKYHYGKLQTFLANASGVDQLPVISTYERLATIFCDYVKNNVDRSRNAFYSKNCQDDTFFKRVHQLLMNYTNTPEAQVDPIQRNPLVMRIFLSCYFPYFMFDFILGNVALAQMNSLDKAPRFFMLRRFAVLSAYMTLFYIAYSLYDVNPSEAKFVMSQINDRLFAKEMDHDISGALTYADVHQDTTNNASLSQDLNKINQDIVSSRSNLNKALYNDVSINNDLKRSVAVKWVWFSFLIVTIVGCAVLYFFLDVNYLYMFCAIMAVVLVISGIVNLAKKF